MTELRSTPELLARSDRSFIRTQRRLRTVKFWLLSILACLYVGSLVYYARALVTVWQGGDWPTYWSRFLSAGSLGFGIARVALWRDARADLFASVADLRQAIRDGDATIAPIAETPWELTSDVSIRSGRLGPLRRPTATVTVATLWGIAVLALLALCVDAPLAAVLPIGLVCILLGWRFVSPLIVRIDLDGLRWRSPLGLTTFAPWRDVKSFFSLTYSTPFTAGRETLYVLDCGSIRFAWRGPNTTRWAALQQSPSEQLQQRIMEYTGLPLRDVTAQARRIAQAPKGEVPQTPREASNLMRAWARVSHLSEQEVTRRLRLLSAVQSLYLILALVSLVAMLVQTPYYEHLYLQAHAHVALYRDALTHADSDWPDNAFSHFANGVYHLQQAENQTSQTYVAAPRRYDHALIEVSGRTGGQSTFGGVGLAISGPNSSSPLFTFVVMPDGWWRTESLSTMESYWDTNSSFPGDMSAIHQGLGVSNQIAVLMNGSNLIFYVNGQYATGYHDDALKGGDVSLYLDIGSDSGDFSNFAVYPL